MSAIAKKPIVLISLTMLAAISLVVILAWTALKPINQKNGFSRTFVTPELRRLAELKVEHLITGIAGATKNHIYFKTANPAQLWVTDQNLTNGNFIALNVPNNPRIASAFFCEVDSPTVHIMAGNGPAIIQTDLNSKVSYAFAFPTAIFSRAVKISSESYIFKGFDTTELKSGQILIKGGPKIGIQQRAKLFNTNEKDKYGIIGDGQFNYDTQTKLITIVSFYNNQILSIDTNLNLAYTWNTIDTVTQYKSDIQQVGNTLTNTTPLRVVNGKNRVAGGRLYNISRLQAENEKAEMFMANAPVDVYDISSQKYEGSFYVPIYRREKIIDFRIINHTVIVIYKNHLVSYELPSTFMN